MALERKWQAVPEQLFTANGNQQGKIQVADTYGFFVKSKVQVLSNTQPQIQLEVKRIEGTTIMYVGPIGDSIDSRTDLSAYTTADASKVFAFEQSIPIIKPDEISNFTYARDPIKATRVVLVDKYGRDYDVVVDNNGKIRLAVDANISVSGISVDLDALTPLNRPDPDNVLIAGAENGLKTGNKYAFVNNIRLQILAAKDRAQAITYADFGTKDERITQIDYTAPSIGTGAGFTARKSIAYTLVGNKYRRDTITWSLV